MKLLKSPEFILMAISFVITLSIVIFVYSKRERTAGNSENTGSIVNRNDSQITVSYYDNDKLHARFTKNLEADERWPFKLFLPRRNDETGATHNVQIVANRRNQVSYLKIGDIVYRCDEARNRRMCEDARKVFNTWSENLDIDGYFEKAMQSDEQTFDFGPYFPTDDCRP